MCHRCLLSQSFLCKWDKFSMIMFSWNYEIDVDPITWSNEGHMMLFAARQELEIRRRSTEEEKKDGEALKGHLGYKITELWRNFWVLLYADFIKYNFSQADNVKLLITCVDFGSIKQTPLSQLHQRSSPDILYQSLKHKCHSALGFTV